MGRQNRNSHGRRSSSRGTRHAAGGNGRQQKFAGYSSTQLKFFRGVILEKKQRAEGDIAVMRESIVSAGDLFGDDRDQAAVTNSVLVGQIARLSSYVKKLDNALLRIEQGSYGRCRSCGEIIPKERLLAVPHATLCMACKSKQ